MEAIPEAASLIRKADTKGRPAMSRVVVVVVVVVVRRVEVVRASTW